MDIKTDLTFIQKHEKPIMAFMLLFVVLWLGIKFINYRLDIDNKKEAVAEAQLNEQKTTNDKLAQQSVLMQQQYQALVDSLSRQNAALASAVSKRNTNLTTQQKQDATLPDPQLVTRWQQLIPAGKVTVQAGNIVADDTAAHETVNELEQVPVLAQNLADTQKVADNRQVEVDKASSVITSLNTQITGLNTQLKDQDNTCKAQVTAIKAQARKSKIKWFFAGFAVGWGSREVVKTYTGF